MGVKSLNIVTPLNETTVLAKEGQNEVRGYINMNRDLAL